MVSKRAANVPRLSSSRCASSWMIRDGMDRRTTRRRSVRGRNGLAVVGAGTFLEHLARRHEESPGVALAPSGESEHAHDPVDGRGMLPDQRQLVDDAQKNGRRVPVDVTVHNKKRQRGIVGARVPCAGLVEAEHDDFFGCARRCTAQSRFAAAYRAARRLVEALVDFAVGEAKAAVVLMFRVAYTREGIKARVIRLVRRIAAADPEPISERRPPMSVSRRSKSARIRMASRRCAC